MRALRFYIVYRYLLLVQHIIKPVIKGFKEINIVKQHIFSLKSIPVITIKKNIYILGTDRIYI